MKLKDREIKGVIFDLDGTLLDSCSIWVDVDRQFFARRGLVMPDTYGDSIAHIGLDKAAIYTINEFHLNEKKEDIIQEWKSGVLDHYANQVELKPNAKGFLSYLKRNNIPFCVATANDEDCYKSALIHHGIYEDFNFILEVGQFKVGKDKPDIFLGACEKLGLKPNEVAIFEDLPLALETAKSLGIFTVGVFDSGYKEKDEINKKEISDLYIQDYQELDAYLK